MQRVFIQTVLVCAVLSLVRAQQCFTPNNEVGQCIEFKSCKSLFALIQKKPLLPEDRYYLSRSQCGYLNGPLVCCPLSDSVEPINRVSTTLLPTPGDGICGIHTTDRIIGGERTKIDEFPWTVLLEYTKPGDAKGFHCGGVLINDLYVLTASHCVNGAAIPTTWELSSVRLGEWDTATDIDCDNSNGDADCADAPVNIPIERKIPHENYVPQSKNQFNDIALLRLSRKVAYSDYIKPVCLPRTATFKNRNYAGEKFEVAGWGKTETAAKSNVKLKVAIDGVTKADCNKVYNLQNVQINDDQICAGGQPLKDSCRGDSGGPLMGRATANNRAFIYLSGLVSYGPTPCGQEGWPGVYTKVGSYIDWIETKLQP